MRLQSKFYDSTNSLTGMPFHSEMISTMSAAVRFITIVTFLGTKGSGSRHCE